MMYIAHGCDRSVGIQCEFANGVLNLSTRHIIFLIGHIDILDVDSEMGYTLIKTHENFNHDTE